MKWVPETIRLKLYLSRFNQIESMRTGKVVKKEKSIRFRER